MCVRPVGVWGENRTHGVCPREIVHGFQCVLPGLEGTKRGVLCNNEKLCLSLQWKRWEDPGIPGAQFLHLHDRMGGRGPGPREPLAAGGGRGAENVQCLSVLGIWKPVVTMCC